MMVHFLLITANANQFLLPHKNSQVDGDFFFFISSKVIKFEFQFIRIKMFEFNHLDISILKLKQWQMFYFFCFYFYTMWIYFIN
jgi:hypothetical protein